MSITFPTFVDKEIVTPEKLNDFVQALEAKFTAGLGTTEIQWPLLAGGDLIMGQNSISGGQSFWNVYNGAQYDDFDTALTAASGGCLFIPAETTIEINQADLLGAGVCIIGAGPTSILKAASGATSYLLQNNTVGPGGLMIANLTLDGNDVSGVRGLWLAGAEDVIVMNVWFKDFEDEAILISGVAGVGCKNVTIQNCHFADGAEEFIKAWDVDGLTISGCVFDTCTTRAVSLEAADSNADMFNIVVTNNVFKAGLQEAIYVAGGAASYDAKWRSIVIADNVIDGSQQSSGTACIVCGDSTGYVQEVTVSGNAIYAAYAVGIQAQARYGTIANNQSSGAPVGISLASSADLLVIGNNLRDCTLAITASSTTDCKIRSNGCDGATTKVQPSSSTDFFDNELIAPTPINARWDDNGASVTIPANTLKIGSVVDIYYQGTVTAGSTDSPEITFGGTKVAEINVDGGGGTPFDYWLHAKVLITAATTGVSVCDAGEERTDTVASFTAAIGSLNLANSIIVAHANSGATITKNALVVQLSTAEIV